MEFKLPDIGEGVVEGELIQWLVKEGDVVESDQAVVEVMTDKATVEVPVPSGGKITSLKASEGDMIKVGQVLAELDSDASASASSSASASTSTSAKASTSSSASASKDDDKSSQASEAPASSGNGASKGTPAPSYSGHPSLAPHDVPAAPIVRAMAQKSGVDLGQVPGSGPKVGDHNRVLEKDLLNFLNDRTSGSASQGAGATQAGAASFSMGAQGQAPAPQKKVKPLPDYLQPTTRKPEVTEERVPVRGLRRVIANAMSKSKYTAPHYSYVDEFECSALVEMRAEAKKIGEQYGIKVSYLPFIVKAVVGALKEFPNVNSSLEETEKGMEQILKKEYNIGIAVATPDGLVVPVIRNADQKNLLQIAQEIVELSGKVRAGKVTSEELRGSTFTITSMGNIGGLFATPIINYPEVGIMGVYKIQEKPLVDNGEIYVGKTMHISMSFDHRVVDGAVGGYFSNAIIERLQNPARLLMELV